ncbi:MAG: hypothetical protein DYG89_26900 [Caldilinea sp. CFX5]|nr:hypothetical protein [Caldilinea sp. CFX5]
MFYRLTVPIQGLIANLTCLFVLSSFLLTAQAGVLAAPQHEPTEEPAPTGVRRVIYPNEWGVARPAGLTYSAKLDQRSRPMKRCRITNN